MALWGVPYFSVVLYAVYSTLRPTRQLANGQLSPRPPPQLTPPSALRRAGLWICSQNAGFYIHIYRMSLMLLEGLGILTIPAVARDCAFNIILDMVTRAMFGLCEPYDLRAVVIISLLADLPILCLFYSRMQVPNVMLSVASSWLSFVSMQAAMSFMFPPRTVLSPTVANGGKMKAQ